MVRLDDGRTRRRHRDHVAPSRVATEEVNDAGEVLPSVPIEPEATTQLPTPEVTEQDARDASSELVTEPRRSRSTRIWNPPDRLLQARRELLGIYVRMRNHHSI